MKLNVTQRTVINLILPIVEHKDAIQVWRKYKKISGDETVGYHDVGDYLSELFERGILEYDWNRKRIDGWTVYKFSSEEK
jgi:hypothetical protein